MFRNYKNIIVLHANYGYEATGTEGAESIEPVAGVAVWFARLNTWFETGVRCLTNMKTWFGYCQKLYSDTYARPLQFVKEQLTGNMHVFAQC